MPEETYFTILRIYLQILVDGSAWKKADPKTTAILLLPGMYQEYRIEEGIKLWPTRGKYLWIGPTRGDTKYTSRKQVVELLREDSKDIIFGEYAANTLEQMHWCVELLKNHPEVSHVIVTTAAYHVPRCVLTLLQVLEKAGKQISLLPWPLQNPTGNSFTAEENFQGELERIPLYQEKGDVASLETWNKYLAWRILQ